MSDLHMRPVPLTNVMELSTIYQSILSYSQRERIEKSSQKLPDDASAFPMAQFKAVNDPTTISWKASDSDIGERTLRIRTTSSFASGRPTVKVNDWQSDAPAAPVSLSIYKLGS